MSPLVFAASVWPAAKGALRRLLELIAELDDGRPELLATRNGGTTLVHSLAHGRPIVSIPLAGDQDRRIRRAVRLQIAATAERTPHAIAAEAAALLREPARRAAMSRRIAEIGFTNGVGEAVAALRALARAARRPAGSGGNPA